MEKSEFITKLLESMEQVKPSIKSAEDLLTDEFMRKHTKFQSFKEMVQQAIQESGMMDEYLANLKNSLTIPSGRE